MCACQPPAVCGSLLQQLATSAHGLRVVLVRLEGGLGIGKLHCVVVHHITPQQQLLARIRFARGIAVHHKCAVADGVARSRQIAHTIGQRIAAAKGADTPRLLVRRQRAMRQLLDAADALEAQLRAARAEIEAVAGSDENPVRTAMQELLRQRLWLQDNAQQANLAQLHGVRDALVAARASIERQLQQVERARAGAA